MLITLEGNTLSSSEITLQIWSKSLVSPIVKLRMMQMITLGMKTEFDVNILWISCNVLVNVRA